MARSGSEAGVSDAQGAVNWGEPSKRDLVERAVSDGLKDAAEIVAFAKSHDVAMTADEVRQHQADLQGPATSTKEEEK